MTTSTNRTPRRTAPTDRKTKQKKGFVTVTVQDLTFDIDDRRFRDVDVLRVMIESESGGETGVRAGMKLLPALLGPEDASKLEARLRERNDGFLDVDDYADAAREVMEQVKDARPNG